METFLQLTDVLSQAFVESGAFDVLSLFNSTGNVFWRLQLFLAALQFLVQMIDMNKVRIKNEFISQITDIKTSLSSFLKLKS